MAIAAWAIYWCFGFEIIWTLSPTLAIYWSYDHVMICRSSGKGSDNSWLWCSCCRRRGWNLCRSCRRCRGCRRSYNFTLWMTIVPSNIRVSRITPMIFVAIWWSAIVVLVNNWPVVRNVRVISIPPLADKTVLSFTAIRNLWLWKLRLWNIEAFWMAIFFD